MAFALNIGKCSLLGNYRENNEDSIDVKAFPELTVSIVADGMGGQAAGEIASRKAVDIIPRELRKNLTPHLNTDGVKSAVRRAIVQANEEIMAMGALDKDMKNMGTTVVRVAQGRRTVRRGRGRQPVLPRAQQAHSATHRRSLARAGAGGSENHHTRGSERPPVP
jgi:serine/threonine protein phosphatase PrpC